MALDNVTSSVVVLPSTRIFEASTTGSEFERTLSQYFTTRPCGLLKWMTGEAARSNWSGFSG